MALRMKALLLGSLLSRSASSCSTLNATTVFGGLRDIRFPRHERNFTRAHSKPGTPAPASSASRSPLADDPCRCDIIKRKKALHFRSPGEASHEDTPPTCVVVARTYRARVDAPGSAA